MNSVEFWQVNFCISVFVLLLCLVGWNKTKRGEDDSNIKTIALVLVSFGFLSSFTGLFLEFLVGKF